MGIRLNRLGCCGIMELQNLSGAHSPQKAMMQFVGLAYGMHITPQPQPTHTPAWYRWTEDYGYGGLVGERFRFVLFSSAGKRHPSRYGDKLKEYILKHNLGKVIETEADVNPNSNNKIKAFMWQVDHEATKAFGAKLVEEIKAKLPACTQVAPPVVEAGPPANQPAMRIEPVLIYDTSVPPIAGNVYWDGGNS